MPGDIRQTVIKQNQVRAQGGHLLERLRTSAHLTHHFDAGVDFLDFSQPASEHGMIVNNQYFNWWCFPHDERRRLGRQESGA